jgi:hypothetical protein
LAGGLRREAARHGAGGLEERTCGEHGEVLRVVVAGGGGGAIELTLVG